MGILIRFIDAIKRERWPWRVTLVPDSIHPNVGLWAVANRLKDHAIALSELAQLLDLCLWRIALDVEAQADVKAGRCFATPVGGEPVALEAGEVAVFTNGQPHIMSSKPGMYADPATADVVEIAATGEKPFCINIGAGESSARLVCGYLACDAKPFNPLLENLPR